MAKRTERVEVTIYKGDGATAGGHQFVVQLFDENDRKIKRPDGCNLFTNISIKGLKQAVENHDTAVRNALRGVREYARAREEREAQLVEVEDESVLAKVKAENKELKSQLLAHHQLSQRDADLDTTN